MVNYTCMQNVKLMVGEGCHTQMGEALKEAGEAAYKENMAKHRERMKQAS